MSLGVKDYTVTSHRDSESEEQRTLGTPKKAQQAAHSQGTKQQLEETSL